tara:strand:- start:9706 stop:10473 length:768 start_codon:yes stop_codon:yes gene_type:complete
MQTKEKETPVDTWEYKDRTYYLKGGKEPLTFKVSSRHTSRHPLFWFDPEKGYNRELRYASNQKTPFVDEQNGTVTLEHIIFEDGTLFVPKEKVQLQKLLSLYHPAKGKVYEELDKQIEAEDQLDLIEIEIEALNLAQRLDVEQMEAILRVEQGSNVSKMSSKELKRDLLLFARKNPSLFLELANDENVILRNFAINAVEANIVKLSQDNRVFTWASNGRKLMTVPFDENPYSAMAVWFQTDEGLEVYKSIEKKLK